MGPLKTLQLGRSPFAQFLQLLKFCLGQTLFLLATNLLSNVCLLQPLRFLCLSSELLGSELNRPPSYATPLNTLQFGSCSLLQLLKLFKFCLRLCLLLLESQLFKFRKFLFLSQSFRPK